MVGRVLRQGDGCKGGVEGEGGVRTESGTWSQVLGG